MDESFILTIKARNLKIDKGEEEQKWNNQLWKQSSIKETWHFNGCQPFEINDPTSKQEFLIPLRGLWTAMTDGDGRKWTKAWRSELKWSICSHLTLISLNSCLQIKSNSCKNIYDMTTFKNKFWTPRTSNSKTEWHKNKRGPKF